jgi:hypothetical protein
VKLFRKPNSRFYWYDFTVRGIATVGQLKK